MSFYERYEEYCKKRNIAPAGKYAAEFLGCSTANISNISKRNITPGGNIVARAAEMLDVSADYLLGITENPHPVEVGKDIAMNNCETNVLEHFRSLNKEGQDIIMATIKGIAIQDIYKKDNQNKILGKKKA